MTLMLDHSQGSFFNKSTVLVAKDTAARESGDPRAAGLSDSELGIRSLPSGSAQISFAGSGMQHQEVSLEFGTPASALQIFLDVPAEQRADHPKEWVLQPADVPVDTSEPGVQV